MSTIVTRAGKGSPLTWNEVDNNFTNLNTDKYQSGSNVSLGTIAGTTITSSALTSGRVTFASTGGLLTDSANLTFNGTSLGIGTASPSVLLQLGSGTRVADSVVYTSTANGAYKSGLIYEINGLGAGFIGENDTGSTYLGIPTATAGFSTTSDRPIVFATNNAERMRLDSSGNLGLGATPDAWSTAYKGIQLYDSTGIRLLSGGYSGNVCCNQYPVSGATYYRSGATYGSSRYEQFNGIHSWYGDAAGAAGNFTPTQRMTLDASGNLGIGTASPDVILTINKNQADGVKIRSANTNGTRLSLGVDTVAGITYIASSREGSGTYMPLAFYTSDLEGMRLDTSGNLSLRGGIALNTNQGPYWNGGVAYISYNNASNFMSFGANSAERMRIDSSGNLLVGTSTNTDNAKANIQFYGSATNGLTVKNLASSGDPNLLFVFDSAQALNNGSYSALYADSSVVRWILKKNGGLSNYSANNSNLSDERTKKDIVNAGNYLDKICAIPVRTFLYKDQTDDELNLGVIAQEVEAVAPELVDVNGFGDTPEDGVPLKSIYQTDLQYALMKCIQELKAELDITKAKVAALEAA